MIPKRIALKNFLSFGELDGGKPVEIAFDDDEHLCILCGANGTGKSAVFDAITYALYGRHRGGEQKAEQPIRHGANGFEVEFEFEFNGIDYRIRRMRPRKGRTTQYLQQKVQGEWKCVRGTDAAGAVEADDIKAWVIETVGLKYEAFTNSVLLRQGDADKLFTASGKDRIDVLKGIIGFEQFEALSGRVHTATSSQKANAELLSSRLAEAEKSPVSDDDLAVAEAAVQSADDARVAGQCEYKEATKRVGASGRREKLETERGTLDRLLAEADERHRQGRQIRQDKATFNDLTAAVPVLENLFKLQERIARLHKESESANTTLEEKTAERDAEANATTVARHKAMEHKTRSTELAATTKDLLREIEQGWNFLRASQTVAELERKLTEFPNNLDEQLTIATAAATAADLAVREAERKEQAARDQLFALLGDWRTRLETTDAVRVRQLAADRHSLIAANVPERFKALEQDEVRRDGWQKQRSDVIAEIDAIPEADRIAEADARTVQTAAKLRADEAMTEHPGAVNHRDTLTQRREEHAKLTADSRMADEQHRLHSKLDTLLGNTGLQLKLTDDAQEQILAFANDTLQNLSDGELSLEVDTDAESTKVFDLRARRCGGEPIGVAFLSGSQRFRVAVSIALAVGRFACDRARRLEAVIIDEGFGSLDPEGLQAMATELKCLQQKSTLRRIILVSHQPEFSEQFPSRYLLTAGPNGTIASRVPR